MAKPVRFSQANAVRTAPPDMKDCSDLPVHVTEDGLVVSCWELTPDELMKIVETRRVWLLIRGGQPPATVEGLSPFVEGSQ